MNYSRFFAAFAALIFALILPLGATTAQADVLNRLTSISECIGNRVASPLACALLGKAKGITLRSPIGTLGDELHMLGDDRFAIGSLPDEAQPAMDDLLEAFNIKERPRFRMGLGSNAGKMLEDALLNRMATCRGDECSRIVPLREIEAALDVVEQDGAGPQEVWRQIRQFIASSRGR